jgi:hypothetical protein
MWIDAAWWAFRRRDARAGTEGRVGKVIAGIESNVVRRTRSTTRWTPTDAFSNTVS